MMPVTLTRDQAQAVVAAAAAERDAIQANLLDLDGSFGKRLLAGAPLTGESKSRWDAAAADLSTLWDTFTAYSAVIDRASEILAQQGRMSFDRLAEASALLTGLPSGSQWHRCRSASVTSPQEPTCTSRWPRPWCR